MKGSRRDIGSEKQMEGEKETKEWNTEMKGKEEKEQKRRREKTHIKARKITRVPSPVASRGEWPETRRYITENSEVGAACHSLVIFYCRRYSLAASQLLRSAT
jgi:phage terminase small subunit